ncbi:hypothetical protein EDC04DRAFT_1619333 [Pisolithus marmoratus]|nr:hypothetical protein EDC04DRAFT_1619333 [Pisolithus marmoratus]
MSRLSIPLNILTAFSSIARDIAHSICSHAEISLSWVTFTNNTTIRTCERLHSHPHPSQFFRVIPIPYHPHPCFSFSMHAILFQQHVRGAFIHMGEHLRRVLACGRTWNSFAPFRTNNPPTGARAPRPGLPRRDILCFPRTCKLLDLGPSALHDKLMSDGLARKSAWPCAVVAEQMT